MLGALSQEDNVPLGGLENVFGGIFVLETCCLLVLKGELQRATLNEQGMRPQVVNQAAVSENSCLFVDLGAKHLC